MDFLFPELPIFASPLFSVLFTLTSIWSLIVKGLALWYTARKKEKYWFVILLIVNTIGILEIIYLLIFTRTKTSWRLIDLAREKIRPFFERHKSLDKIVKK